MIRVQLFGQQAVFTWPHGWQSNSAELLHILQGIQRHADRPLYVPNEEYQAYYTAKDLIPTLELLEGPEQPKDIAGRVW